jgi:hypothetical protein
MKPQNSDAQLLDLHVRLEPALAERVRAFATLSDRTLCGSIRLLLREGLGVLHHAASDRPGQEGGGLPDGD